MEKLFPRGFQVTRIGIVLSACFALLFTASGRAESFDEACASLPTLPLATVSTLPITIDDTIRGGDIHRMTVETTGTASLGKRATVGTTFATRTWEASYGLSMLRDPDSGRVCYRPAINVIVGYEPLQISVAHPFQAGSCAFAAIVEHEREHVNIYSQFLAKASHSIEAELRQRIAGNVRYASSLDAANAQMRQLLRSQVHEIVRSEMARGQPLHDEFDSIDESLRLLNACNGEIRRGLSREVLALK
jgi:hypothetical protein